MSRRVRVSDQAKSDLDEIWDYVARKQNIDVATRVTDSIASRFPMLGRHPNVGRQRDDFEPGALCFPVEEFLEQQVSAGAYSSVSDYIRALVQEDQKRKALEAIEALLLEGLNSEASEMTAADWAELKQRVWDREVICVLQGTRDIESIFNP